MAGTLYFEPVHRSRHQLVLNYRVDDIVFSTAYWYDSVDFFQLEKRFGEEFMQSIYFHLLAFEANKAASLKPKFLDVGPYADFATEQFFELWKTFFNNVWGVWRHDNDITDYLGPDLLASKSKPSPPSPASLAKEDKLLAMCGGGKDSLAVAKLLEAGDIKYDALIYSHSVYGNAQRQHDLIDDMLGHTEADQYHRAWVFDTAIESPAAKLYPEHGVKSLLSAETVSSYWTALPIALQHDYTQVALGITRSTDEHNLVWDKTGEEINYLWGMSSEAERLLHDYIKSELVTNLSYFHILRSVYDIVVFNLIADDPDAVASTHSCAKFKPWCCRCPKCIYVWMHIVAYHEPSVVDDMFDVNLFDLLENRMFIRKMLGLEGYKPNDCMGTVSETQVAYLLCRQKGVSGKAVEDIESHEIRPDLDAFLKKYGQVDPRQESMPKDLFDKIEKHLQSGSQRAQDYVRNTLGAVIDNE